MCVSSACLPVWLCWCLWRQEGLGTGVPDGCEHLPRCWELKPGPPEEQPVPLPAEPALQHRECQFLKLMHKNYPVACLLRSNCGDRHRVMNTTLYIYTLGICPLILFLITVATWPDYLVSPHQYSKPSKFLLQWKCHFLSTRDPTHTTTQCEQTRTWRGEGDVHNGKGQTVSVGRSRLAHGEYTQTCVQTVSMGRSRLAHGEHT